MLTLSEHFKHSIDNLLALKSLEPLRNLGKYFTFMFALGTAQIDPESTACYAICDNSLGHHQNCLHNTRKLPQDHLVLGIDVTV